MCRCMEEHPIIIIEPVRDFGLSIVLIVKCACAIIENELMNEVS